MSLRLTPNSQVRLRLTPKGHALYYAYVMASSAGRDKPVQYVRPVEDSEGWSDWTLWEVLDVFGAHVTPGVQAPFLELEIAPKQIRETV